MGRIGWERSAVKLLVTHAVGRQEPKSPPASFHIANLDVLVVPGNRIGESPSREISVKHNVRPFSPADIPPHAVATQDGLKAVHGKGAVHGAFQAGTRPGESSYSLASTS